MYTVERSSTVKGKLSGFFISFAQGLRPCKGKVNVGNYIPVDL